MSTSPSILFWFWLLPRRQVGVDTNIQWPIRSFLYLFAARLKMEKLFYQS